MSISIADHAELGQLDHRYAREVPFINPVVTLKKIHSQEISLNSHPYRIRHSEVLSEGTRGPQKNATMKAAPMRRFMGQKYHISNLPWALINVVPGLSNIVPL